MVLFRWMWSSPLSAADASKNHHRDLDFNYKAEDHSSEQAPAADVFFQSMRRQGFAINHSRVKIGHGQEPAFNRAKSLLQDWRHFQLGWAFVPPETKIEAGQNFSVCSKEALAWIVNPLRIRYVRDDPAAQPGNQPIVYAFGAGTLQGHLLAGEERFAVEWNKEDGSIWYEIFSFSRPAHFLSRVTYPYVRFKQHLFAKQSSERMIQEMRRV